MAESVGSIINNVFSGESGSSLASIVTTFLWTFVVLILTGLVIFYLYYLMRYNKKHLVLDVYNDKVRKDRSAIVRQRDGTEFMKFFWTKHITFPPKKSSKVYIKYGASKFDIIPAYGNPTNVYAEVRHLISLNPFKKKEIPAWVKRDVNKMLGGDDPKLKQVDYDAMDVFAALLPSQTRKYQTPGIWEKYGSTISMMMVLVTSFIFFFFLADQFGSVAEVLKGTLVEARNYIPPKG